MSIFLAFTLITHIVAGLIGLAALHFAYMQLLRSMPPYKLVLIGAWVAVGSFFLSWSLGAYYYVIHYGSAVKPRVLESYPWAHQVFMEAKEHVFIFIPFLTIAFALSIHVCARDSNQSSLKRAASILAALALVLGVFVTASGILISGAVR